MKLVVTGAASHLAGALLPELFAHPDIHQITGIDLKPARFAHPKYRHQRRDIREPGLEPLFSGADGVIHLAFVVLRSQLGRQRHNRELVRSINVNGSIHVFEAALRQRVGVIVHLSSAAVYGAWPDNPRRIDEDWPRRVMHGFSYAEDKNAVEDWLDHHEGHYPDTRIVRLRPHAILGPHGQPFLAALLRQPCYPAFPPPAPLTQCVWEDDVVAAIIASLLRPVRGAFNLAAEPAMSFEAMLRLRHRWVIPVPFTWLRWLQRRLWRFSALLEEPGWLDGMPYSLALNCRRAEQNLSWHPRLDTVACLQALGRKIPTPSRQLC